MIILESVPSPVTNSEITPLNEINKNNNNKNTTEDIAIVKLVVPDKAATNAIAKIKPGTAKNTSVIRIITSSIIPP